MVEILLYVTLSVVKVCVSVTYDHNDAIRHKRQHVRQRHNKQHEGGPSGMVRASIATHLARYGLGGDEGRLAGHAPPFR